MKLKITDVITIAVVTVISFPLLYLIMLFVTGSAHIEFGSAKVNEVKEEKMELVKQSTRKDSLANANSKVFQALRQERIELENERMRMREQQDRISLLQSQVEVERKMLAEERGKMEILVSVSDSLGAKKIKDLAKMYGAMRPSEAASILSTMEERMVARIVGSIGDDRQKAKILSSFSGDKAARISRIIGGQ